MDWLFGKQGATICDFNDKCKSKIQASSDDNYVKEMKEEEIIYYKKLIKHAEEINMKK